jgi:hypothetical protein
VVAPGSCRAERRVVRLIDRIRERPVRLVQLLSKCKVVRSGSESIRANVAGAGISLEVGRKVGFSRVRSVATPPGSIPGAPTKKGPGKTGPFA